jgi:hypothetical protein
MIECNHRQFGLQSRKVIKYYTYQSQSLNEEHQWKVDQIVMRNSKYPHSAILRLFMLLLNQLIE